MGSLTKMQSGESMQLSKNISSSMQFHRSRSVHQARTNFASKFLGPMVQEQFRCAQVASKALSLHNRSIEIHKQEFQNSQTTESAVRKLQKVNSRMNRP